MSEKLQIYIGTFSETFYSLKLDTETLEVEDLHPIHDPAGRSAYFALSPDSQILYVANEFQKGDGGIAAFRLKEGEDPEFLNAIPANTQGPAHISAMTAYGQDYILGSGYFDSDVMVCPVADDGSLKPMSDNFALPDAARAHSVRQVPGTNFVIIPDTWNGLVYTFEMMPGGKLEKRFCYAEPGLACARHTTFSRDGKQLYLLTEKTSTLDVFDINRETGELTHTAHFDNLPEDYEGRAESSSSGIHSSPDGRFLYLSNRGHNSLTIYSLADGNISRVGWLKDEINWPREFMFTPDGSVLLIGNQEESSVSIYRVDTATGIPVFTGKKIKLDEGPASFISIPKALD